VTKIEKVAEDLELGLEAGKRTLCTHGPGIVDDMGDILHHAGPLTILKSQLGLRGIGLEDSKFGLEMLREADALVAHGLVLTSGRVFLVLAVETDNSAYLFELGDRIDEMATKTTRGSSDENDALILTKDWTRRG
jgi:hypothetical protein